MKITINCNELLPALQTVASVVERRQSLPILSNFLFQAGADGIQLTATDMEVEISTHLAKTIKGSIETTLPARKLLDICRALPADAVLTMEFDGDRVNLTSGRSRFVLATLSAREYPVIEMADDATELKVPQAELKILLERTAFAMAVQDVRYYLNGLLLDCTQGLLRAVATDGHRLALCELDLKPAAKSAQQIIVPRKGVLELTRLLSADETPALIYVTRNHIRVHLGDLRFTSKLIDGKFPEYEKVIPAESKSPLLADREQLRQGLIRASILSNEKYRGVRVSLSANRLRALAHNPEQEEAEEEIEVQYQGDELEIGFNVSYLLDALGIIRSERVRITMTDPSVSALLLPDEAGTRCKYVVMPMRL
jgi:DNA polymerase-3 subunit beta